MSLVNEEMQKHFPHGAVAWDYGTDGIYESKPGEIYRNTFYPASERCPELRQPELQRKPEATAKASTNPCHMSRDEFDRAMQEIAVLESDSEACKRLKALNRRLLPYVSRKQELMWVELCGTWFKRKEGGGGKA